MNKKKLLALSLVAVAIVAAAVLYVVFKNGSKIPDGYVKVTDYTHTEPGQITCDAVTPSCGYCPGTVIDKSCYVKPED